MEEEKVILVPCSCRYHLYIQTEGKEASGVSNAMMDSPPH